jgi:hypothetical protein
VYILDFELRIDKRRKKKKKKKKKKSLLIEVNGPGFCSVQRQALGVKIVMDGLN